MWLSQKMADFVVHQILTVGRQVAFEVPHSAPPANCVEDGAAAQTTAVHAAGLQGTAELVHGFRFRQQHGEVLVLGDPRELKSRPCPAVGGPERAVYVGSEDANLGLEARLDQNAVAQDAARHGCGRRGGVRRREQVKPGAARDDDAGELLGGAVARLLRGVV